MLVSVRLQAEGREGEKKKDDVAGAADAGACRDAGVSAPGTSSLCVRVCPVSAQDSLFVPTRGPPRLAARTVCRAGAAAASATGLTLALIDHSSRIRTTTINHDDV